MTLEAPPARQPYGWAIEYRISGAPDTRVAFLRHDDRIDYEEAMRRAVALHGELVPLIANRRRD